MCPPRRNGSIASSSSARPQRAPIPLGPHILCAGDRDEVEVERLDVDRAVRAACAPSATTIAPRPCAQATSCSTGLTVPRAFETRPSASDLDAPLARDLVERVEPEVASSSSGTNRKRRARRRGDVLPRDVVRVVLELGRDDDVSRARGSTSPQAYATRLIPSVALRTKIDLARRRRVEDRAHGLARATRAPRWPSRPARRRRGARLRTRSRRTPSSRREPPAASARSPRCRGTRAASRAAAARRSGNQRGCARVELGGEGGRHEDHRSFDPGPGRLSAVGRRLVRSAQRPRRSPSATCDDQSQRPWPRIEHPTVRAGAGSPGTGGSQLQDPRSGND